MLRKIAGYLEKVEVDGDKVKGDECLESIIRI